MDDTMLERRFENIDLGLARVEQILPTLATKDEIRNLDERLGRVEQILPTLATKEELRAAVAPLATREELRVAVAPLATREELRSLGAELCHEICEEGERSRRHMDILSESQREDIQLLAEHLASGSQQPRKE